MDKKKKHERSELDKQLEKKHRNTSFNLLLTSLKYYIIANVIVLLLGIVIEFLLEFAQSPYFEKYS